MQLSRLSEVLRYLRVFHMFYMYTEVHIVSVSVAYHWVVDEDSCAIYFLHPWHSNDPHVGDV